MTEYTAATVGLFPLPDRAKERLESLKGHQKEDLIDGPVTGEVAEVYDRARAEALGWQRDAGLDVLGGGQLTWDDLLASPLVLADAVETAGIERYYDNNNFYREPIVRGDLEPTGIPADQLATVEEALDGAPLGAVVPGPYTLADLAVDEHYGDRERFEEALSAFLADEAAAFPDAVDRLFVLEPSLGYGDHRPDPDRTASLLDHVADATAATSYVHVYWGAPAGSVYRGLLDGDVDGVGLDLVTAGEESRRLVSEYGAGDALSLGVVDSQRTAVADAGTLRAAAEDFLAATGADPSSVTLTPHAGLFYLPTSVVTRKLDELGAAVREAIEA